MTVRAENTAAQLYQFYQVPFNVSYPKEVISTIDEYLYGQRFVRMYSGVSDRIMSDTQIDNEIGVIEVNLSAIAEKLDNGYLLSLDEIYSLESEYGRLTSRLNLLKQSLESVTVTYTIPTLDNTPSYDEYVDAMNKKSELDRYTDIGKISFPMELPVVGSYYLVDNDNNQATYTVMSGTTVAALWNGTVSSIDEDRLVISSSNEILLGYAGLSDISVKVGDTVYQGQTIGKSSGKLTLRLRLAGEFVDVGKMFEKE